MTTSPPSETPVRVHGRTGAASRSRNSPFAWITETFADRDLLVTLALRDLRTKYRRTVLGWLWSLANPLFTTLVYTVVFSVLFQAKAPQSRASDLRNFAFFLLCGILPWNAFTMGVNQSIASILGSASLIKRVSFRRHVLVGSAVLSVMLTFMIELGALGFVLLFFGNPTYKTVPILFLLVVLLGLFTYGLALALSACNVYFRDTGYLVTMAFTAWFYLTPIVYVRSIVPNSVHLLGLRVPLRQMIELNPLTGFIDAFRDALYDVSYGTPRRLATLAILSFASACLGSMAFAKLQRRFAEEL